MRPQQKNNSFFSKNLSNKIYYTFVVSNKC